MEGVLWLEGCQQVGELRLLFMSTKIVSFETFWNWWFWFSFLCCWCCYLLSQWILLHGLGLPLFLSIIMMWSFNQRWALLWILIWRAQCRFVLCWSVNLIAGLGWLVLCLRWNWTSEFDFLVLILGHLDSFTGVCYTATCTGWPLLLAGGRGGSALLNIQHMVLKWINESVWRCNTESTSKLANGGLIRSQFSSELLDLQQIPLLRRRIINKCLQLTL